MTMDQTPTPQPIAPAPQPVVPVTPVAPVPTPSTRSKGGGWLNIVLVGALAIAIGGIAFALGRSTAPAATTVTGLGPGANFGPQDSFTPGDGGPNGGGPGFLGAGGLTIDGVVASIGDGTMTITLDSGESMTVTLDDATTYRSAAEASEEDVAVGDDVAVQLSGGGRFGTGPNASSAPSVTARDVTVLE